MSLPSCAYHRVEIKQWLIARVCFCDFSTAATHKRSHLLTYVFAYLLTCNSHVTDPCCNSEHNCPELSTSINDRQSTMKDTHFNELGLCAIIDRCFTIQHKRRHGIVWVIVWEMHGKIHLQCSACCAHLTRPTFHVHLPMTQQTQHSLLKT